jgi:hypothetical protein
VLRLDVSEDVRKTVIVVDNASEDGSWEELLAWRGNQRWLWSLEFPNADLPPGSVEGSTHRLVESGWDLTLLRAGQNRGYAAGANIGLRVALSDKSVSDFWVLNSDVVLEPSSLGHLLDRSAGHPQAIYGSTLLYHDDPTTIQAAGGAMYIPALGRSRHFGKLRKCDAALTAPKFDYIVGAALFFSREVTDEIGLIPESFYIYFEETEWALRARSRGIELVWVPEARLTHKEGRSTGAGRGFRRLSDLSFRYIVRNSMLFTEMRHPMWLMTVLLFNMFECARYCLRGDVGKLKVLVQALREYWSCRHQFAEGEEAFGD